MNFCAKQRGFICYFAVGLILGYLIGGFDTSSWKNSSSVSSSTSSIFTSIKNINISSSSNAVAAVSKRFLHEEEGPSEDKEEKEEGEEGEEEEIGWNKLTSTIVCIALFLIFMTIAFEELKESMEHHADREMEPILEKMFAELTVLGFLSMFSFILSKTGVFEYFGEIIFGSGEELTEIFEVVHMVIFVIMVFFVLQIMILLKAAMAIQEQWEEMDIYARSSIKKEIELKSNLDPDRMKALQDEEDEANGNGSKLTIAKIFYFIFPFFGEGHKLNQGFYEDLREEFLRDRAPSSPHLCLNTPLGDSFNFGRYLGSTLVETLEHVTDVTVYTWGIFAGLVVAYYLVMRIVQGNMTILSWLWPTAGWMTYIGNTYVENHLVRLRCKLLPPKARVGAAVATETDSLVNKDVALPAYCNTDIKEYVKHRNWFTKLLLGSDTRILPQNTLYLFEKAGPKVYMHILQINVVYTGLYVAMLFLSFLPYTYKTQSWLVFFFYSIFSILPIYNLVSSKERLVATLTQVRCIGIYRHPQHIACVLREQKTMDVVRTFLVVSKLHQFAKIADVKENNEQSNSPTQDYRTIFDEYEIKEIGKTFDKFDDDGSGSIEHQEFFNLMKNIDSSIESEKLERMVNSLDKDGDGSVDKDEFLQWYAEQMIAAEAKNGGKKRPVRDRAKDIFDMFDDDGSGNLSLSEFKSKLDVFGDFTLDEIGELVTELDHDRSNEISVDEFEELIKRYEPRDIKRAASRSLRSLQSA